MSDLGKTLVLLGAVTLLLGLALWWGGDRAWFGRLPGDLHVTRGNTSFHFPIVTCLLLSALLSAVLWLLRR